MILLYYFDYADSDFYLSYETEVWELKNGFNKVIRDWTFRCRFQLLQQLNFFDQANESKGFFFAIKFLNYVIKKRTPPPNFLGTNYLI